LLERDAQGLAEVCLAYAERYRRSRIRAPINPSIAFGLLGEADFRSAFFIFDISRGRPEKGNSRERQYLDQRPNVPAIFLST
jgi:hypothetical protein